MRPLPLPRLLSLASVACAAFVWFAPNASADAPIRDGWWSKWQQPTEGVGVTLPITVPPPPTGEPGGLTIARDATGEVAVAALHFQIDVGADATVYLDAAGGRDLVLPPGADVKVCEATKEWEGDRNGPWSRAPTWGHCESGALNQAQSGYVFNLAPSMQDEEGVYSVVIVPGGQAPYTIDFAATNDSTLVPGDPPPEPESTTTTTSELEATTTTTSTTEPVVEETDPLIYTDIPPTGGSAALPVVTTAVPRPSKTPTSPTSLVAFEPRLPRLPGLPDTRMERIMAVSLLLFMAVALWWLGGSPTRMPRLIGALAGDGRPSVAPPASRGVGRFARPRDDVVRPPRL